MLACHFNPSSPAPAMTPPHKCCIVCAANCKCGDCDFSLQVRQPTCGPVPGTASERTTRSITAQQRDAVTAALYGLKQTYFNGDMLTGAEVVIGLDNHIIKDIANNIDYILSIDDLVSGFISDVTIASHVWDIISLHLGIYEM